MTESKIDAQASHSSGRDGSALHTQLLARGVRMTAQRAAVVAVLEQFSGHVTAEEVYLAVQPLLPNINLATVYRTLEMMKALGLLSESRLGSAKAHYARKEHATHHHLLCRNCKRSWELPDDLYQGLIDRLHTEFEFEADFDHTVIYGWCAVCREQRES